MEEENHPPIKRPPNDPNPLLARKQGGREGAALRYGDELVGGRQTMVGRMTAMQSVGVK